MEPHNKRFPKQWEIVTKHVDFKDKSVLDLGCGYGDMVLGALQAGARNVMGFEHDPAIATAARLRVTSNPAAIWIQDITTIDQDIPNLAVQDVIICFSVIPYIDTPKSLLAWIARHSSAALIEVQYRGDGPGDIKDDEDMARWLGMYWKNHVRPIGYTTVEYRNVRRTIWLCE